MLVHLKDGSLVAGYWGPGAYASLSPNAGDLYLTEVYNIGPDRRLGVPVPDSDGLLIRRDEYSYLELFQVRKQEAA